MSNEKRKFDPRRKGPAEEEARWKRESIGLYPALCRYLEGSPALFEEAEVPPGTVMFYVDGAGITACLLYKDTPYQAFVPLPSLQDILGSLDQVIADGNLSWKEKPSKGR